MCGACAAPALRHLTLWIMAYSGACLATAARLRWDPSTYVALRWALPAEAALLPAVLAAAALLLAALAHAAHAALAVAEHTRRAFALRLVGLLSTVLVGGTCYCGVYVWGRVAQWRGSAEARRAEALARDLELHLQPLLQSLTTLHLIPAHVSALIEEARENLPWNVYIAEGAAAGLVLVLVLTAALSLLAAQHAAQLAARQPRRRRTEGGREGVETEPLRLAR